VDELAIILHHRTHGWATPGRSVFPLSKVQAVVFNGPAGHLEGILKFDPKFGSPKLAVVCHPHPLYHGTMHNKVVYAVASALFEAGCIVLRFNFRGVGLSEGRHDNGRGEIEDTLAAIRFLKERYPALSCLVAGFSFGAWMALEAARRDPLLISVILVAPPLTYFDSTILADLATSKLFLQGTDDEICNLETLQSLFPSFAGPKDLVLLRGAGHFFNGQLTELKAEILAKRGFLGIT